MKIEYRPCNVTISEKVPHGTATKVCVREGLFHCWTSEQWICTPIMQGQAGGQMQGTYGIVELRTGEVKLFSPGQIRFMDSKIEEYEFRKSDQTVQQAVNVLRDELLKHGDLYAGSLASIESAIKEGPCVSRSSETAERILKRLIGE